jgi:hypothetical protein
VSKPHLASVDEVDRAGCDTINRPFPRPVVLSLAVVYWDRRTRFARDCRSTGTVVFLSVLMFVEHGQLVRNSGGSVEITMALSQIGEPFLTVLHVASAPGFTPALPLATLPGLRATRNEPPLPGLRPEHQVGPIAVISRAFALYVEDRCIRSRSFPTAADRRPGDGTDCERAAKRYHRVDTLKRGPEPRWGSIDNYQLSRTQTSSTVLGGKKTD